jgi:predicted Ser/Thr protein kinase
MTVQDLMPERLGPYRLLERLGEGGMGIVYLARDSAERKVAVKALRPGVAAEPTARRRLAREVETMRRVHSPHVAEVIDADVTSDPPYIVTRFVPGRTLEDIVGESGPLGGEALARLAVGLAEALTSVHAAGVVHRDLKPGNVLMVDGEPVVIDFGIAQLPETTRLTMTGMFMGTPGYLAPEVIEGKQSGPAADVHSLGATMAFAATGRPPFGTGTFEAIFYRIVHGQPDLAGCPVALLTLIATALARDPARRPAAAELCERASAIEPSLLRPGPAAAGGLAAAAGMAGRNGAGPAGPAGPSGTRADLRPWAAASGLAGAEAARAGSWRGPARSPAGDFSDLLPPASYQPPAARPGAGRNGSGAAAPPAASQLDPAGRGGPAGQAAPAAQAGFGGQAAARPARDASPRSAWSPLVIAALAVVIAVSVAFPLAGTVAALAFLLVLSAAGRTGRRIARRRSRQGTRLADLPVAAAYFPLALCRSAIRFMLLAPVAVLAGVVVAAITIISMSAHPLPRAFALGTGALIAVYALGPGSAACRGPLSRCFGSGRGTVMTVIAFIGVAAAAGAAIAMAVSQPPSFWPAASPSAQVTLHPAVHSMLYDIRTSLLTLARHFGV